MVPSVSVRPASVRREGILVLVGLAGLTVALALRVVIAGPAGARSVPAGVVFGVALLVVAAAIGFRAPAPTWRQLGWGVAGAVVLCVPAAVAQLGVAPVTTPVGVWPTWAAVVTLVAVTEELLLRGALFDVVTRWRGDLAAIAVTTVAFGLLHVPLYGWAVLPLDVAVGVFLGVLRVVSGSWTAPAVTHVLADLAGWWLR